MIIPQQRFPPDQLAIGAQVHKAPRILKLQRACALLIQGVDRSVLAGCLLSASLARAYQLGVDEFGCDGEDNADGGSIDQHVDDLFQPVWAKTSRRLRMRALTCGSRVANLLWYRLLTISDKSTVVASDPKDVASVAEALRRMRIAVRNGHSQDDCGVQFSAGARRSASSLDKRFGKAPKRAKRIRSLLRVDSRAKKLYTAGVQPMQNLAASIVGASVAQVKKMRRSAVLATYSGTAQPCVTTLLCTRISSENDPAIAMPMQHVKLWAQIWNDAGPSDRK